MGVAVGPALEHVSFDQPAQPLREHRPADAKAGLEVLESAHPCEGLTEHYECPAVAEQCEWSQDRARFGGEVVVSHAQG
jgi:hypothetical protein